MPTEVQDDTTGSAKPPTIESADPTTKNTQSALNWLTESLHGAGSTLFSAFSGWGTRREISEFVQELHQKYIELEERGFIEIDPSHKIASAVMLEFLPQFDSRELELQAKGQKAIDLAPRQMQLLMSAYVLIAPRDRWNQPDWRGWSLGEHEQLRDLFNSDH